MIEHPCGAYPAADTCSHCGGPADRDDPASIQGVWYYCQGDCRPTLVIDHCECEDDGE